MRISERHPSLVSFTVLGVDLVSQMILVPGMNEGAEVSRQRPISLAEFSPRLHECCGGRSRRALLVPVVLPQITIPRLQPTYAVMLETLRDAVIIFQKIRLQMRQKSAYSRAASDELTWRPGMDLMQA